MTAFSSSHRLAAVLLLLSSLLLGDGVIVRSYNEVRHTAFDSFAAFEAVYLTHEGGRTNTNLFVGVATPECQDKLETAAFRGAQRHAGGSVVAAVSLPAADFPLALDACAEVFFYPVNTLIDEPQDRYAEFEHTALTQWGADQMRVKVTLTNGFPYPIETFWIDESTEPASQGVMAPGEHVDMTTFLGHVFYAVDPASPLEDGQKRRRPIDWVSIDGEPYTYSPQNRLETCELVPGSALANNGDPLFVDASTLTCDDTETRFVEFSHTVWHVKRLGLNYVQPQLVPPVTAEGFVHAKLPPGTYAWLKEWYDAQRALQEQKESSSGPCMNQHVSPSTITHLPPKEKDRLSGELQETLEAWYGKGPLELTSIYGVRKYTNGSVLRMHVDTVNTHVVSAIINVDQQLDEEWPLLILDHDDNEHEVLMRPGDMVLYESAKLLHGRPSPMRGTHYDNIFIHYKPTEGWDFSWV